MSTNCRLTPDLPVPNRDGHVAMGGCIYCDGRGSKLRQKGELPSVAEQIASGKKYYSNAGGKIYRLFSNIYKYLRAGGKIAGAL